MRGRTFFLKRVVNNSTTHSCPRSKFQVRDLEIWKERENMKTNPIKVHQMKIFLHYFSPRPKKITKTPEKTTFWTNYLNCAYFLISRRFYLLKNLKIPTAGKMFNSNLWLQYDYLIRFRLLLQRGSRFPQGILSSGGNFFVVGLLTVCV